MRMSGQTTMRYDQRESGDERRCRLQRISNGIDSNPPAMTAPTNGSGHVSGSIAPSLARDNQRNPENLRASMT